MYKTIILILAFTTFSLGGTVSPHKPKSKYIRPCLFRDHKCIRDNLAANSQCRKVVKGSLPSQFTIKKFAFETPYFNASYVDNDLVIQNLDKCQVSEFFFNVKTDVAVLAIDCKDLIFTSNRTMYQHYSLLEDQVYSYNSTWKYPLIRMTTNIPKANAMNLCTSFVFTDVAVMPKFIVSPNDKHTENFLSRDLSVLNIYERETFSYRGNTLFKIFVDTFICYFGCN